MKKRLLSWLMVLTLCLTLLPTAAFAAGEEQAPAEAGEETLIQGQPEEPEKELAPESEPALLAVSGISTQAAGHDHCLCGAEHKAIGDHTNANASSITFTAWTDELAAEQYSSEKKTAANSLPSTGNDFYYLTKDVKLSTSWKPADKTVLCLNGHSITSTSYNCGIMIDNGVTFTLTDCNGSGKSYQFADGGYYDPWKLDESGSHTVTGGILTSGGSGVYIKSGTFNMYGGTIVGNSGSSNKGGGVFVGFNGSGNTFNMYGGAITGNRVSGESTSDGGAGVYVRGDSNTFNMYGGEITNNATRKNASGGGVNVYEKATFNMTGGTIGGEGKGNTSSWGGGGVYMSDSTFTMSGTAKIADNIESRSSGGGVDVSSGTFTMSGDAKIINNKTTGSQGQGGGVYMSDGQFTMSGNATITGNSCGSTSTYYNGGGVFVSSSATLTVSGNVQITGNTKNNKANNIYLGQYNNDPMATIKIGEDGLNNAKIGVTAKTPSAGLVIATGATENKNYTEIITSDDDTHEVAHDSTDATKLVLKVAPEKPHTHFLCTTGNTCTKVGGHDCGSNKTTFIKWTDELAQQQNGNSATAATSLPKENGNYYLTDNVTLVDSYWTPKSGTVLCLNGYSITRNRTTTTGYVQDYGVINITGSFTLADCKGKQGEYGKITHGKDTNSNTYPGRGVSVHNGSFTMYGGNITGNKTSDSVWGSGVYVGKNGDSDKDSFTMYGGKISGNTAPQGGGVYVCGSFTMYGGEISGNEANYSGGGGVVVENGGTFTMKNGTISDNAVNGTGCTYYGGGGVDVNYDGTFTMEGGTISRNKYQGTDGSYVGGGGVHVRGITNPKKSYTPFIMKGGTISDNETNFTGGGVYVGQNTTFTMKGGTISNNKAATVGPNRSGGGGGVYAYGSFTMTGGEISGNNCDGSNYSGYLSGDGCLGGGVYVVEMDDDAAMTVSGAAKITGNTQGSSNDSTISNVYLPSDKTITIGGELTSAAGSIGVTTATDPTEGRPVTIATAGTNYAITGSDKDKFASDKDGFKVECKDDKLVLAKQTAATEKHKHCLCGKTHTDVGDHQTEQEVTFARELKMENGKLMKGGSEWIKSPVNRADGVGEQTGYVLSRGEYYLYGDITLSDAAILINGDVKLCLNGHTIDRANKTGGADYVIWVLGNDKAHLTLTDCKGTGKLTGGKNGGVDVFGGCALDMFGGTITGNEYNGGVNIGQLGKFNMYGGEISGNSANYGGGVSTIGTFNMYGGTITRNSAKNSGGGVYMEASAGHYQGGILTVSGSAKITDNKVNGVANNVYLPSGKTFTLGSHFTKDTYIGVTTADEPILSSNVIIAKNVGELDYTNIIKSDSSKYVTKQIEGNLVLGLKGSNPQPGKTDAGVNITAENANDKAPTEVVYGDNFKLGTTLKSTGNTQTSSWTWTSSNNSVLAVTGSGSAATVKALKPGEATITVKYESDSTKGTATATIKVKQRQISVKVDDKEMTVGGALPTFTVTYGNFASGNTANTVLETQPVPTTTADGKTAGSFDITVEAPTIKSDYTDRYTVGTPQKGTLTVKAASTPSTPSTPPSGSSSGSSTIKTETTINKDGSVTRTETKSDGTVIETTTNPDGSTSKTESKTTTKSNGLTVETVTETNTGADGSKSTSKTETTINKDGSKTEAKTETKTEADGTKSETKSETKTDANGVTSGTETTKMTAPNGSTGTTTTTTENGNTKTEAETKISNKAVEDAKKSGEAVKVPTEVKAGENSNSAPTVKVELPKNAGETKIEIPVSDVNSGTVAVIVHPDGTEEIVKDSKPTADGVELTVDGSATVKVIDNSKDFIDTRNHWSRDEVNFVASREIFNGVGGNLFGVGQPMTRGMVNTVLARLAGIDTTPSAGQKWYEVGTEWAKSQGITDGTNPEASVTREQLATLLYRFCGTPTVSGVLSFADAGEVSDYAQSALLWATQNDILNGVGNNRVAPNADAQRAQVAAMMARYLKNAG